MLTRLTAALLLLAAPAAALPQGVPIEPLRWEVPYSYPDFIGTPWSVAVGDHGAFTIVGRMGPEGGVDIHAGGRAQPLWMERLGMDFFVIRAAAADHAPVAATFTLMDVDPDPASSLLEARLRLFELEGSISESWSQAFATGSSWYWDAGGVALSDDGEVVVGWWDLIELGVTRVVALDRDGGLISQTDLPMKHSGYRTGGLRLSDDGLRALVPVNTSVRLLDIATGAVLASHTTSKGVPLTSIALSGDGRRFAAAAWDELVVLEETPSGAWTEVLSLPQVSDEDYGPVSLSQDGARLAYTVQYMSPQDRFELVLLDVDAQTELMRAMHSEPATWQKLHANDVVLDDAGRTVACASLGDSELSTPQVLVYDDAGRRLSEHFLPGSALDVDLDPRGEVLAVAGSAKHGPSNYGGHLLQADARPPKLRVLGSAALGTSLDVTLAGSPAGGQAYLLASPGLGSSATPFGTSALDLELRGLRLGPWPVVSGLAQQSLPIAADPALAGLLLHFQGVVVSSGGGRLTDKVSVRIVP
jgi:hypothetical protein